MAWHSIFLKTYTTSCVHMYAHHVHMTHNSWDIFKYLFKEKLVPALKYYSHNIFSQRQEAVK